MKLLIAGGHVTPAASLIKYAKDQGDEITYVGRTYASAVSKVISPEKETITALGAHFTTIDAPKFESYRMVKSLLSLPKLSVTLRQSLQLIKAINPDVVISFGGYIALPLTLAAYWRNVPVITHEQTNVMGLANSLIARYADLVAVSWEQLKDYNQKTLLTGNLLRDEFFQTQLARPSWLDSDKPIIYVTGGSQGAKIINEVVSTCLEELLESFTLIHQCGKSEIFKYQENLTQLKQSLPKTKADHYYIHSHLPAAEVAWVMRHARMTIARAGANTVSEVIASELPAIFIPLPIARLQEQHKNAAVLASQGGAYILDQDIFSKKTLLEAVKSVDSGYTSYKHNILKVKQSLPNNAVEKIYQEISKLSTKHSAQKS